MESVWDYPRPPRLEAFRQRLEVASGGVTIVATTDGYVFWRRVTRILFPCERHPIVGFKKLRRAILVRVQRTCVVLVRRSERQNGG